MYASTVPSLKRLRDFKRIAIKAGETKTVTFELDKNDLSFVRQDLETGKFETVTEDGEFKVMLNGFGFDLEDPEFPWTSFLSRTYKNALSFTYKN